MKLKRPQRALIATAAAMALAGTSLALLPPAAASARIAGPPAQQGASHAPFRLPGNVKHVCSAPRPRHASCDVLVNTAKRRLAAPRASSSLMEPPYGPAALQAAYGLTARSGSAAGGSGQTVAIVDAYDSPNVESDLAAYRSYFGLSACTTANGCFSKINQSGQQGNYPKPDPGWGTEEALDVEMVSAVCPNCHITLVEASSNSYADLWAAEDAAINSGAGYISNSWGGSAPDGASGVFASHPGVVVTASTGDSGYGVSWPAAYTNTVAVGGTSLLPAGNSRGWAEVAWPGGGSGCSPEPKPSWQTDTGCAGHLVADVSAVADPETGVEIYDSDPNGGTMGWGEVGGTSASSPIIAAVYALAGTAAGDNGAAVLYKHSYGLNDILTGMNSVNGCTPWYLCHAGYGDDGPTGLGTPDGIGAFSTGLVTVMGDSYSAGEGNGSYDDGTDTNTDKCHRSSFAFGRVYAGYFKLPYVHTACSGAVMDNIMNNGQYTEQPQINQVDPASTVVTVTIGGNDAGFAKVLTRCLNPFLTCEPYYTQNDNNNLHNIIEGLKDPLTAVYTAIKNRAPHAQVIAMTYPVIFTPDTTCLGVANLGKSDVNWFIYETEHLDDIIVAAAKAAGINYLDVRNDFAGHGVCDPVPWAYPLPLPWPSNSSLTDMNSWFHPNITGQAVLANQLISYYPAA